MFSKTLLFGFSAVTNLILVGVGGAVAGAATLKIAQALRNSKEVATAQGPSPAPNR